MDGTFNLSSSLEEAMDKDILIVPFKQHLVYVSGSVNSSGTIPFIENRTALYYIGLAGGFNRTENLFGSYSVRNVYGEKLINSFILGFNNAVNSKLVHPLNYIHLYQSILIVLYFWNERFECNQLQ